MSVCLPQPDILSDAVHLLPPPPPPATTDSAKQEADTNICAHLLQVQSYKGPTFCDHCGRIMIGIAKQGLKCEGRVMRASCIFFQGACWLVSRTRPYVPLALLCCAIPQDCSVYIAMARVGAGLRDSVVIVLGCSIT